MQKPQGFVVVNIAASWKVISTECSKLFLQSLFFDTGHLVVIQKVTVIKVYIKEFNKWHPTYQYNILQLTDLYF